MDARQSTGNQTTPSRNPRPDLIEAAVKHIETLAPDAHNPYPLWHGWAIRDAFIAGHQYLLAEQSPDPLLDKITTDIRNIKTALDQYHPTTLTEVSFIQQIDKLANMVLLLATTLTKQRPIYPKPNKHPTPNQMTPGQICNQDDITFTNDPLFLHNIRLREELKKRYTNCIFMLGIGLFFGSIATFLSIWLTYTAVMYQIRSEHPDAHWQIVHK